MSESVTAEELLHIVTPEENGRLLRDVLRRGMRLSYGALKSAKWHGHILLNGEHATVDRRVSTGDTVRVLWPQAQPEYLPTPFELPLTVPYLDEHLMIIDKPAPLPTQTGTQKDGRTLENAVFRHFGCPSDFIFRPVNRLDKGTSGLMAVALDAHTQQLLQGRLHS